jgi:hypothetical protein
VLPAEPSIIDLRPRVPVVQPDRPVRR